MEQNEQNIISEIRKGNASIFKDVYRLYFSSLCHFAYKYFNDKDEAEDIVQETMVKTWEQRQKLDISNLKSYLFSSVKNNCINRLKHLEVVQNYNDKAAIEIKLLELEYDEAFLVDDETPDLEKQVVNAIDELPEQCGKIVRMKYIDGMKAKDIAEATNLSQRTVETHIYKGLKTLSQRFRALIPIIFFVILHFLQK